MSQTVRIRQHGNDIGKRNKTTKEKSTRGGADKCSKRRKYVVVFRCLFLWGISLTGLKHGFCMSKIRFRASYPPPKQQTVLKSTKMLVSLIIH